MATLLRRDIWSLGTPANPWDAHTLAYALAVREMQSRPISNPTSWAYQAAIHGTPASRQSSPRSKWNQCQHATWYFLPWHRMYIYRFEQIVRSIAATLPQPVPDWTLPYWDYSSGHPGNALPPAFRTPKLPDGTDNPLFVSLRRPSVNSGQPLPPEVTDTSAARAETVFSASLTGATTGFGGPSTGWTHQGPAFGTVEAQPHGPVHVWVGGANGLMLDPATAARDPIFWLHHANIDRLWAGWNAAGGVDSTTAAWRNRSFTLPDAAGVKRKLLVRDTLETVPFGYRYDPQPLLAMALAPSGGPAMPPSRRPILVGANDRAVTLHGQASTVQIAVREPGPSLAAGPTRTFLNVAGIVADDHPGTVYGVYVNLSPHDRDEDRAARLAGVVSFFGITESPAAAGRAVGPDRHDMRYAFDITAIADRLRAEGAWDAQNVAVTFAPIESGHPDDAPIESRAASIPVRIGTVSIHVG